MQIPVSLVMRTNECFYCPNDGARQVLITDNFGLLCCDTHLAAGKRDCNAWLHSNEKVRLRDAKAHPGLKPFFDALPAAFPTVRKSGLIDPGWSLLEDWDELLFRDDHGNWCIRIGRHDGMTRGATIRSFLDAGVPGVTAALISSAIVTLDEGVYDADVAAQEGLQLEVVKEMPGIGFAMHNGVLCRIFEAKA